MSDILDLDALVPPTKQLKIQGRVFNCNPLTVGQLIKIVKLQDNLAKVTTEDEVRKIIDEVMNMFIQGYDKADIDLRVDQIKEIIDFAMKQSVPEEAREAKDFTPEKKVSSVKESPTSSTSTPATK